MTPTVQIVDASTFDRDAHVRGGAAALVTLLAYGDFECMACSRAHTTVRELEERFGDDLRVVFRHMPLARLHRRACLAACAAEAAAEQGRFWEMHDALFERGRALSATDVLHCAHAIGLEPSRFLRSLASERCSSRVQRDVRRAIEDGALDSPALFLNAVRYEGPIAIGALAAAVERERDRMRRGRD